MKKNNFDQASASSASRRPRKRPRPLRKWMAASSSRSRCTWRWLSARKIARPNWRRSTCNAWPACACNKWARCSSRAVPVTSCQRPSSRSASTRRPRWPSSAPRRAGRPNRRSVPYLNAVLSACTPILPSPTRIEGDDLKSSSPCVVLELVIIFLTRTWSASNLVQPKPPGETIHWIKFIDRYSREIWPWYKLLRVFLIKCNKVEPLCSIHSIHSIGF